MTLADYLAKREIKPSQFAREADLPASTITRIMRGERDPRGATIRRICEASKGEITVADLVGPLVSREAV